MAAANMLYPILDMQPAVLEANELKKLPTRHECIEFRNVSFSYDGDHYVLEGRESEDHRLASIWRSSAPTAAAKAR